MTTLKWISERQDGVEWKGVEAVLVVVAAAAGYT
jgi:hypothetical protein